MSLVSSARAVTRPRVVARGLFALALLAGEPAEAAPDPSAAKVARFAVAVGFNGADAAASSRERLHYADDDAARYHLQASELNGARSWLLTTFDDDSARLYPELTEIARAPTRDGLAAVLGEIAWAVREARRAGARAELTFYFAGHGDVGADGTGYLVFADGPFTRADLLRHVIAGSPADINHVILDACASYLMVPRGERSTRAVPLTAELLANARAGDEVDEVALAKTGFFVATSSAAEVHESPALGGGVFSYLLRSALLGGADVNGDGRIEYVEAEAFVAAASSEMSDERTKLRTFVRAPPQRPHTLMSDLRAAPLARFLVLDDGRQAHVKVMDALGRPYAEVHREGAQRTYVALMGHPFFLVQRGVEEAVLIPRGPGAYSLSALAFGAGHRVRGDKGPLGALWRRPFGNSFMVGFLAQAETPPPLKRQPFTVDYAAAGAPPARFPWLIAAGVSAAVGAALAAAAFFALAGNSVSYAVLQARFQTTGRLDPALSLRTDAFMTAAALSGAAALVALGSAAGLATVHVISEDE